MLKQSQSQQLSASVAMECVWLKSVVWCSECLMHVPLIMLNQMSAHNVCNSFVVYALRCPDVRCQCATE